MLEVISDALFDSVKMLPILYLTYLLIEYYERNLNEEKRSKLVSWRKFGPLFGAMIGCLPQCGFSIMAASLYARGTITTGTLMAVFISTSDEALPVLLSNPQQIGPLLKVILIKVLIAIIVGYIIDLFYHKSRSSISKDYITCDHEDNVSIWRSALSHTIHTFMFILIINFVLTFVITFVGEHHLANILLSGSYLQPFLAAAIGLIPNCASSILIAQLYIIDAIPFATLMAGLISSAGVGLLVLFKVNKNFKENVVLLIVLYFVATISGLIFLNLA